jgi:hypothetical protein
VRTIVGLCLLAALPASAAAQERPPSEEEKAAQAAQAYALMGPGPEHERLAALEGEWDLMVRFWSAAGAEPVSGTGRAVNRMILGGRFLETRTEGSFAGQPIASLMVLGFDRRAERYTSVGFDTWGTYYVTAAGGFDAAENAIVMDGTDDDPVLGHTQRYRMVLRPESADRYAFEIWFSDAAHAGGGDPLKVYEAVFTRPAGSR